MSKIEWTDKTWNPVWGCRNHCEYCYARKMAKRFAIEVVETKKYNDGWGMDIEQLKTLKNFEPTWLEYQFRKKLPKKPSRIFVNSMSDIAFWKTEWMEKVLDRIKEYPQHSFQFLTKVPRTYDKYDFPSNCWLGITVTSTRTIESPNFFNPLGMKNDHVRFISIEPIVRKIDTRFLHLGYIDWVIIGSETGNRKGKTIPRLEWIKSIVELCLENEIPIFLKNSLKDIIEFRDLIQRFPEVNK